MKIYLIRHGQTTGDLEDRYGGDYDDHLTEAGRKQSQRLAGKLASSGIEIIFCSPKTEPERPPTSFRKGLGAKLRSLTISANGICMAF